MLENKFYKVSHNGGEFVTGLLFNPVTGETQRIVLADFDDVRNPVSPWYDVAINREAAEAYRKILARNDCYQIGAGDTVEVFKGRKIPVGTVAKVVKVYDWRDSYGRTQTRYAVFEDGRKTSVENCRFIG